MNKEIKEILNKLEIVARKHTIEVCENGSKIETMPASVVDELRLNNYSAKLLLDYITNLQEKYERMKENAEILSNGYNELEKRNEKAIEKLESIRAFGLRSGKTLISTLINEIVDILNGGDDNE